MNMTREEFQVNVGETLQHYIKASHYSQKTISEQLDMNPQNFSALLKGRVRLDAWRLLQLCQLLQISADRLLGIHLDERQRALRDTLLAEIEDRLRTLAQL